MKWNRVLALISVVAVSALAACGDDDNPTDPTVDPPTAVTNLEVTSARTSENTVWEFDVTVAWDENGDATGYNVALVSGGDTTTTTVVASTGTRAQTVFNGVSGGSFTVAVVATNDGGSSPESSFNGATLSLNEEFYNTAGFNNIEADPQMPSSAFEFGTLSTPPDFRATMPTGYTAATLPTTDLIASVDGRALVQTTYAGAVDPAAAAGAAWYEGWTVWSENGSDSRPPDAGTVVQVTADVLTDQTWTAGNTYVLNKPIFVGADCGPNPATPIAGCTSVTLTIEPGVTVVGRSAADVAPERGAYLVVHRGSRLVADATPGQALNDPRKPLESEVIVFTSIKATGSRASGDWGGLVINGRGQTNAGDEATGEGDSGLYGGTDDTDDSGVIRGVRIEFAGDDVTPTDQLNGLALQGVGAGTTISYVQIHYNRDDGIEPFGGAASVDHLVVTGIGDDSVDGTDGYRGFMQFVLGQQNGLDADNGFEISNNGDDEGASPRGTAVIANATMIGAGENVVSGGIAGPESDNGIQFREGSFYRVYNSIFTGFGEGGFCIRDAQTIANALQRLNGSDVATSTLSGEGLIMWDNQAAGAAENFAACGGGSS
jgi:hypothetical protein